MLDAARRFFSGAPPVTESKVETGSGVYGIMNGIPLTSISDNPVNKIAEAQALFRQNPWVAQAERAIVGRYVAAGYHLEDSQGNTVGDSGPAAAVKELLDNPSTDPKVSRRALWRLTLRHEGLAGNGFWYLDQRLGGSGPPLQLLYINPARMTPVENEAGKLIGWVMDHPQNPVSRRRNLRDAVPFDLDEVRHFILDEPDWGHYGIGIAEAAYNQIQLDNLAVKHSSAVFAAGGRLAGLVTPKPNVTISDEQWDQLIKNWRSVAADPDAAKRLIIARGPVDFLDTTANPSELQMTDLLKLSRDDIFTAWGVPLAQAPIATPGGLNSGFDKQFDEAALWQGAIDYRASSFEEQVQSIIDLFDLGLRLVVEKPAFDDQAPLFENAAKGTKQPLTNNERRAMLGFDPLEDDELGKAIFMESVMVRVDVEPEPTPPQLLPFTGGPPPPSEEDATPEASGLGEASQPVKAVDRGKWEKRLQEAIQSFLAEQAESIANRVKRNHAHIAAYPHDTDSWWSPRTWDRKLTEALEPLLSEMAGRVATDSAKPFKMAKAGFTDDVVETVRRLAGKRISGINQTTRDAVTRQIIHGLEEGLSPADLAQRIREASTFDESRAELIARTETGNAYNHAAVETFRRYDVESVEVIDGDHDEECAAANGSTWTLDEAMANPLAHPNCVRDFIPVVPAGKAEPVPPSVLIPMTIYESTPAVTVNVPKPDPVTVNLPELAPVVNVEKAAPPVVNVAPSEAVVNVTTPEVTVNVPEQKAPKVGDVRVVSMPTRLHRVKREKDGKVSGSVEEDA